MPSSLRQRKAAAEKVFGKGGSKADVIRFSIDGGDSLKVKLIGPGQGDPVPGRGRRGAQKKVGLGSAALHPGGVRSD